MSMLSLNCQLLDEDPRNTFTIHILDTDSINTLKEKVKEKISNSRPNVDARQLILLGVSIRHCDLLGPPLVPKMAQELAPPMARLAKFFDGAGLLEDHIHVLVKIPDHIPRNLKRTFDHTQNRKVTPKAKMFGTIKMLSHIDKELDSITPDIEEFLRNPEKQGYWKPPSTVEDQNTRDFLEQLRIPMYPDRRPSLLYHNLRVCDDNLIKEIFGNIDHYFFCNTSGAGKTRRLLEGLTKNWGFYFVAIRDTNRCGVGDLEATLVSIGEYEGWMENLDALPAGPEVAKRHALNVAIAKRAIKKLLAARILVFRRFLDLALYIDGRLLPKHRELWLRFQLSDNLQFGRIASHPFVRMKECLDYASDNVLQGLIAELRTISAAHLPENTNFIFALDESQRAVRLYRNCFVSSGNPTKFRSILRAIVDVFTSSDVKVIVSGTGLSLQEVEETLNSAVGKPDTTFVPFVDFGIFDGPQKLDAAMQRYLPSAFLESESGQNLQLRIRKYLPGRHRFLISFVELLLANGLQSPHTLLNKYVECYAQCTPGDIIHHARFISKEPKLHVRCTIRGFDWDKLREDPESIGEIAMVVQSHLTKGETPIFGPLTKNLVEFGVACLRHDHKGYILEPLAFISVLKWFERQKDLSLDANLRKQLAISKSRGYAYEEVVILYLVRTFCRPVVLSSALNFHGEAPTWAKEAMQIVARLDQRFVPVNVLEDFPVNPALGVVHYAHTIEEIIEWIEGSSIAPAVLVPTHLFGPDVIVRLQASGGRRILLIGQLKSYLDGNIHELNATTTTEAIKSLNPKHWFKRQPQERRQKLIDAIHKYSVLRLIGGYPLPPDLNSAAPSVQTALSDLGPVALATPKLDDFRDRYWTW